MKALFLKDIYTLKEARLLIALTIGISVFMAIWGGDGVLSFVAGYVIAICAVLVINAVIYDEMDNGYAFLMTLPFSTKQYVLEKYLFGLAAILAGGIFALLLGAAMVHGFGNGEGMDPGDSWGSLFGTIFAVSLFLQAVMIPVQFKFGKQKGKLVIVVIVVAVCGIGAVLTENTKTEAALQGLSGIIRPHFLACGILFLAACFAVSILCSIRIMERKEF